MWLQTNRKSDEQSKKELQKQESFCDDVQNQTGIIFP
jgi:hypothetical protein